jgi:hypothetical protein
MTDLILAVAASYLGAAALALVFIVVATLTLRAAYRRLAETRELRLWYVSAWDAHLRRTGRRPGPVLGRATRQARRRIAREVATRMVF